MTTVTLIEGDGIGPEVAAAAVRVIAAAGGRLDWERQGAGLTAMASHGEPLPVEVLDSIRRNRVALKGPVTTPVGKGFRSVNVQIRQSLQLFANLRPVHSLPNVPCRFEDVDLVIVRENTEGMYSGIEHEVVPGVVESLKIITRTASTRIARFAFRYARDNGRRRVTAVHKANIMKMADGLFLDCCREVSGEYEDIEFDDRIIDATCMRLVVRPADFDVLVLPNLYGDIVSDLAAGLIGGLGLTPGANLGEELAVFEAVHGSAPDIAGQNLANPTALIQSGVLMLEHLGQREAATRIRQGLRAVFAAGILTGDLGGSATTTAFTDALVRSIEDA
jgi:isocitrate dehydrogenase (NAD+)